MKKRFLRITAVLLALLLSLSCMISCSGTGKTLLSLEKDGIKVSISQNIYQLMLSRIKGTLYLGGFTANGYTADYDIFWSYTDKFNGSQTMTLDQYYREMILDNCRTYLVALYLFEQKGLSLSEEEKAEIDDIMFEYVRTDGNGSKTKLNAVLSEFGVNYNILKEAYTIDVKVAKVQSALYGSNAELIGETLKNEYMEENYVHFRQIFLPAFHYVYETDKNGDTIYYYTEGSLKDHICYDQFNGVKGYNEDGSEIKDKKGDIVYFVDDGTFTKIAYNASDGTPAFVPTKDGLGYETTDMTKEELENLKTRVDSLYAALGNCSATEFEQTMRKESADNAEAGEYDDGYYLQKNVDYSASGEDYAYLGEIVSELDKMAVGDMKVISSKSGYHIIRKYEHSPKAYESEVNENWFKDFNSGLIEKLFLELCEQYYPEIALNEAIYEKAPSMKDVGINMYY